MGPLWAQGLDKRVWTWLSKTDVSWPVPWRECRSVCWIASSSPPPRGACGPQGSNGRRKGVSTQLAAQRKRTKTKKNLKSEPLRLKKEKMPERPFEIMHVKGIEKTQKRAYEPRVSKSRSWLLKLVLCCLALPTADATALQSGKHLPHSWCFFNTTYTGPTRAPREDLGRALQLWQPGGYGGWADASLQQLQLWEPTPTALDLRLALGLGLGTVALLGEICCSVFCWCCSFFTKKKKGKHSLGIGKIRKVRAPTWNELVHRKGPWRQACHWFIGSSPARQAGNMRLVGVHGARGLNSCWRFSPLRSLSSLHHQKLKLHVRYLQLRFFETWGKSARDPQNGSLGRRRRRLLGNKQKATREKTKQFPDRCAVGFFADLATGTGRHMAKQASVGKTENGPTTNRVQHD